MKHLDDETLSQLREGDLDGVRAVEVRAHLETCDECRARAEALERMLARLTEPPEEEIPPLLAGRLAEEHGRPGDAARRTAWRWIPAVAGVAAVLVVAVVAVRLYSPGPLGGPAGAPPAAEKAAAPSGDELNGGGRAATPSPEGESGAGTATADSAAGTHSAGGLPATDTLQLLRAPGRPGASAPTGTTEPRVLSAAAPTSALDAYAGPALPIPLFDMPRVGIDQEYLRAIVSQPGILAYARRHARGVAQAWNFRYGRSVDIWGPGPRVDTPGAHEAIGLASLNDRDLILAAVAKGVSGTETREAIDRARKTLPGTRSGPMGWAYEAPIIWMARGDWEPTGEQAWVVVVIDVFSPIEGAFKVQAVVLDSKGSALSRAGSGAETAAPLR